MNRIAPELSRCRVIDIIRWTALSYEKEKGAQITIGRLEEKFRTPELSHCYEYFLRLFLGYSRDCLISINHSLGCIMVHRPPYFIPIGIFYPPD